jgi:glycosyltransferase involved in cell wall biosynthesis
LKVAVVTPVLAHYRKHLFRLLDKNSKHQFVHYSVARTSQAKNSLDINAFDPGDLREFVSVENYQVGRSLWQKGVVRMSLKSGIDACVFTGNAAYLSTWVAAGLARLTGKKVYMWTIGWHRPERGPKRWIRLGFYRLAHRLMIYGDPEKERAVKHGYPEHRIDVVYNSVTSFSDVASGWNSAAEKEYAVGAIIRLNPVKKLHLLLEAVAELNREGQKVKVILAGDGPERESLENLARTLEVDCEFTGAVYSPADISALYRRMMVTVVPSTAGLTTVQSMAHGVPVITDNQEYTQAPEASAIIEGKTGSRFEADNATALATEISDWLSRLEKHTPQIAEACRSEVRKRWSPEVQAANMIASLDR